MTRILLLGGYGGFGGRIARRLADAGHEVLVAGRSFDKAQAFCGKAPRLVPLALDAAAKDADVVLLSGASSVPALSGAAVRHLAGGMDKVRAVEMAIYRVGLEYASSLTTAQPRLHPLRHRVMRET